MQDVAVQTTHAEPTRPPIEAEWPLNRGHVIAFVLSLVIWVIGIAVVRGCDS